MLSAPSIRLLITGTRRYSISTFPLSHSFSLLLFRFSIIYPCFLHPPVLIRRLGEMIDRTENRSRRDSRERCILLVCLVEFTEGGGLFVQRGDVALRRRSMLYCRNCSLYPDGISPLAAMLLGEANVNTYYTVSRRSTTT